VNKVPHTQHGAPCPCDLIEVRAEEAIFLELFDGWYGDKSYRQHQDALNMIEWFVTRLDNQRDTIQTLQDEVNELRGTVNDRAKEMALKAIDAFWNPGPIVITTPGFTLDVKCDGSDHPGMTCDEYDEDIR